MHVPVVLKGRIENYNVERQGANFIFTESDGQRLGAVAIGAAMMGLSGQAIISVAASSDASEWVEEADRVEFELNGQIVKAWLWLSPFKSGDEVEIVTRDEGNFSEAMAVVRPSDRLIALYPHVFRGRNAHIKTALKIWIFLGGGSVLLVGAFCAFITWLRGSFSFMFVDNGLVLLLASIVAMIFLLLPTYDMTKRWMKFVYVAEDVFTALKWENVRWIDLKKSSNSQRKPEDPPEYGHLYYRY